MNVTSIFFSMGLLCLSCKKESVTNSQIVAFYLLKECHFVAGKCAVDPVRSSLQDTPVIRNQEILEYAQKQYQFKLSDAAVQKIKALQDYTAFAVTVDRQVIYYGIFKPLTSSSSCEHSITMDLDRASGKKIKVSLGYPSITKGLIFDERNNEVLIAALRNQGKLR